jgi:hypothetical protein
MPFALTTAHNLKMTAVSSITVAVQVIQKFPTGSTRKALAEQLHKHCGNGPSSLEWIVVVRSFSLYINII